LIQETRTSTVQSTITGQKVEMKIAEGQMAHVMGMLTNLYADPVLAIIREYSTNGLDAHVAAGYTGPVEVTTPSALSPFFKVKDHGTGLSVEDIHNIYSQYGASTKRDTNDQVGSFGLGCKAALAYADQFTLTSCKDGTKVVVSISRDEDGVGQMTIADTLRCDEGNGTEVLIPAKPQDDFVGKARAFFSFWDEGTVLVNGEAPKRFEGLKIADDLYVIKPGNGYGEGSGKVVMGNVAYPIPAKYVQQFEVPRGVALIYFVDLGTVTLPPNRESIMDTPRTDATMALVNGKYQAGIKGAVQRAIDKAATAQEAIDTMLEWASYLTRGNETFKWQGKVLPQKYEHHPEQIVPGDPSHGTRPSAFLVTETSDSYYRKPGKAEWERAITIGGWPKTLWVEDFTPEKHTAAHKRKLLKYIADSGLEGITRIALFKDKVIRSDFHDPTKFASWDTIKAIKIENTNTLGYNARPARLKGSYDCYINGNIEDQVPADDIDTSAPVFWLQGNVRGSRWYGETLNEHHKGSTVVCLPGNRIDKFRRDFPTAKTASQGIQEAKDRWAKSITADQQRAIKLNDSVMHGYRSAAEQLRVLDDKRVVDPELRAEIRSARMDVTALLRQRQQFGESVTRTQYRGRLNAYPLYDATQYKHDHTYLYLNAAYTADQAVKAGQEN
jgi:hypothetical protein